VLEESGRSSIVFPRKIGEHFAIAIVTRQDNQRAVALFFGKAKDKSVVHYLACLVSGRNARCGKQSFFILGGQSEIAQRTGVQIVDVLFCARAHPQAFQEFSESVIFDAMVDVKVYTLTEVSLQML
jgi:hypothetical protein